MYFQELPKDARLWVYQANRVIDADEKAEISSILNQFISSWAAHGVPLKAETLVLKDHFIIFGVDEKQIAASGCSIDSSVKLMKEIGEKFTIDFFDRLKLIIEKDSEMKVISFSQLGDYSDWKIYNTLVNTVEQFNESFLIQVKDSELYKLI
jgi:hypothetical protein